MTTVSLRLGLDDKDFDRGSRRVVKNLKSIQNEALGTEASLLSVSSASSLPVAGAVSSLLDRVFDAGLGAARIVADRQLSEARLRNVLEARGDEPNFEFDALESVVQELAASTIETQTQFRDQTALLLRFPNIGPEILEQTLEAAADLSAAGFGDLRDSSVALAWALEDPKENLEELNEVFPVLVSDLEKIRTTASNPDLGGVSAAQQLILNEIDARFGNVAEELNDTLQANAQNLIDEAKQGLANLIPDFVTDFSQAVAEGTARALKRINRQLEGLDSDLTQLEFSRGELQFQLRQAQLQPELFAREIELLKFSLLEVTNSINDVRFAFEDARAAARDRGLEELARSRAPGGGGPSDGSAIETELRQNIRFDFPAPNSTSAGDVSPSDLLGNKPGVITRSDIELGFTPDPQRVLRETETQLFQTDNAARQLGFTFSSAFEDAAISGRNLSDVLNGLLDDITRIILRLTVTQPLAEGLTGLFSGIFSTGAQTDALDIGGILGSKPLGAASGGLVSGPGSGVSDSILARLSNGEFVVNAGATGRFLPLLESINDNRFQSGGLVGLQDPFNPRFTPSPQFNSSVTTPPFAAPLPQPLADAADSREQEALARKLRHRMLLDAAQPVRVQGRETPRQAAARLRAS